MEELSNLQLGYFHLSRGKFSEADSVFSALIAAGENEPTVLIGKLLAEEELTQERQLSGLPEPLADYPLFAAAKAAAGKGYLATLVGYEQAQQRILLEKAEKYKRLTAPDGKSEQELEALLGIATELGGYKAAAAYKEGYLAALHEIAEQKAKQGKKKWMIILPIVGIVLAALITCGMIFSLPTKDGVRYGLTLNGFQVLSADDAFTELTLPEEINGIKITGVGHGAFEGHTALKKITFNGYITDIGVDAFAGCTALEEVENSETVMTVDKRAFEDCKGLSELRFAEGFSFKKSSFRGCKNSIAVFEGEDQVEVSVKK